jgi:hypothetical protein
LLFNAFRQTFSLAAPCPHKNNTQGLLWEASSERTE